MKKNFGPANYKYEPAPHGHVGQLTTAGAVAGTGPFVRLTNRAGRPLTTYGARPYTTGPPPSGHHLLWQFQCPGTQ
ncbi:hypothetical protein GCM10020254_13800 [Streptomyces goshikiensis]